MAEECNFTKAGDRLWIADSASIGSGTGQISRVFGMGRAGGISLTSFKNLRSGFEWAVPDYCDFAFASLDARSEGLSPDSGFRFSGQQWQTLDKGAKALRLDFRHQKEPLKLSLFYTSFPGTRVLEQRCRLQNIGGKSIPEVSRFDPVFFKIRGPARDLQVHAVRRSQYALERLPIGEQLELRGGGWNAAEHAGFVTIENVAAREFLFLGIEWERGWAIRFKKQGEAVQ
ncbi:MAG: hypothetical protein L0312_10945 [Acidobacteria bacterium]|nr:hypothetical protein [Acidobacteriota bacterium]